MSRAESCAEDTRPLQHVLVDEFDQRLAELVFDQSFVAVIDGEREEGAAWVVDADKRAVSNEVQALNAAIIRMRPPADIRKQAGGMAEPPLLGRLDRTGRPEQRVGPEAQLVGAVYRARPAAGDIVASCDQDILALLLGAQQAVEQTFADAEHRDHDRARLHLPD